MKGGVRGEKDGASKHDGIADELAEGLYSPLLYTLHSGSGCAQMWVSGDIVGQSRESDCVQN